MNANLTDSWESGDSYENFMGRWSRLVGELFIDWLAAPYDMRWLDIGCGTGALSESIQIKQRPYEHFAVDESLGFVRALKSPDKGNDKNQTQLKKSI